jgi:hypothetical protein
VIKVNLETINPWTFVNVSEEVDFEALVALMDDEIREDLHNDLAGKVTEQEFTDAYQLQHILKFGEPLFI